MGKKQARFNVNADLPRRDSIITNCTLSKCSTNAYEVNTEDRDIDFEQCSVQRTLQYFFNGQLVVSQRLNLIKNVSPS